MIPFGELLWGHGNNSWIGDLNRLRRDIQQLQSKNINIAALDELTIDMGLLQVGEFRTGDGEPGEGFTGVRISYPGITYGDSAYVIAGVLDDVLQFGITELGGTGVSGGGSAVLDIQGIRIYQGATERARLGDLNGFLGYTTPTYGVAVGEDDSFLKYDPTNGLRVKGTAVISGLFPGGFDIYCEEVSVDIDGSQTYFAVKYPYIPGTLMLLLNGIWLKGGGTDYSAIENGLFKMLLPPQTGDTLRVNYIKSEDRSSVYNETPTGAIDGSNQSYSLAYAHIGGSLQVFLNNVTYCEIEDFVNGGRSVSMTSAPQAGDKLIAVYLVEDDDDLVFQEAPTGLIDGSNTVYTLAYDYAPGSLLVALNGLHQTLTADYTETDTNEITFADAPQTGDSLWITYRKA